MEQQVYSALNEAKAALKFISANVKDGSQTQRKASDALKKILDVLLPVDQTRLNARGYDPALVYPSNNPPPIKMIEMSNENQKPQMQVMQVLQNTPAPKIAELEFVKQKFIDNYNLTHKGNMGDLMYHRQLVFFKQLVSGSEGLKSADPFSLYACLCTLSVKGWSLDPLDNEVYMFPRDGKAVLQPQAGAYVKRLIETRQIVYADQPKLVYRDDEFKVSAGRVITHIENFKSEEIVGAYVRFVIDQKGNERFFIYRKSDWLAWKKKSPNKESGVNKYGKPKEALWDCNDGQPEAAFLKTKIILHATKEKCWATGTTNLLGEQYDVIVSEDLEFQELPPVDPNATYQPAMVVSPAGNIQDNSFAAQPAQNGATVTYTDDDF